LSRPFLLFFRPIFSKFFEKLKETIKKIQEKRKAYKIKKEEERKKTPVNKDLEIWFENYNKEKEEKKKAKELRRIQLIADLKVMRRKRLELLKKWKDLKLKLALKRAEDIKNGKKNK